MPSLFLSKNDTCIWSSVMLELELPPSGSGLDHTHHGTYITKERKHRCLKLTASIYINWTCGGMTTPGIALRKRRSSHAGPENPRTLAPPIHNGSVAL